MIVTLPDKLREALDGRAFAHLTTLDPDGFPHATAMWIMRDDDMLVFNTATGRRKHRNLLNDPRLSVSISPPGEEYINYSVQGRVVEMRESDGIEVIDTLARKYLDGVDKYPWLTPGMVRVTMIVEPTRIASNQ